MIININSSINITASKNDIFELVSDHEGTSNWVEEVRKVILIKEGIPKNGKNAIREVHFKPALWSTIQERITFYEEGSEYHYKIISMSGVKDHLGKFILEENSNGEVTVRWEVYMQLQKFHPFRLFSAKFNRDFKAVQEKGLGKLKSILEN